MCAAVRGEDQLGNYQIGAIIGSGTFGKVRLATHILTNEKVAVKILEKDKIVEESDIERITREICILKILRHPNIIQLYEIIETKTAIHLIMEYAEGGELYDYIVNNKRIQQMQAVGFMHQIFSGVEYIHKIGIVHRDLKPQNLLLDSNKNIKIVDFGLSNQYKTGQKLKTACGSPCYAAPEMIAGQRYECINVDIWSCGIIIYAMLCGYLPFEDLNTNTLYRKIILGEFQMPRLLSNQAKDILKNILNVNPEIRFKIPQIRDSKWYNLNKNKLQNKGIIVGKDQIIPDQIIVKKMEKYDFDPVQTRTYIINNRHNHVTTTYYLLQKKIQKQPKKQPPIQTQVSKQKKKREQSPLIYRPPDKKYEYYMPIKKQIKQNKDASKNDSINASNIISSLVEANKNKLINQKINNNKKTQAGTGNFQKTQNFKIFPKKINTSIYQSDSTKKMNNITPKMQHTSQIQDKSFDSKRNSVTSRDATKIGGNSQGLSYSSQLQASQPVNKKRQQLSQQLKQISVKIDKQIVQLKKQNQTSRSQSQTTKKQINAPYIGGIGGTIMGQNRKRPIQGFSAMTSRGKPKIQNQNIKDCSTPTSSMNNSFNMNARQRIMSQGSSYSHSHQHASPKPHTGPFNVKCLFMQNIEILIRKIKDYLLQNNIPFVQQQLFTLRTSDNHTIWIESISNQTPLYLVNFTKNFPNHEQLLNLLTQ